MTQPKQASRASGGMRVYRWPPHPPHDLEVVGVTSIIGNGIPKQQFLAPWSAKMVAEYAVDKRATWQALADDDPKAAIDLLKRAPYRSTAEKADMGTVVHGAVEAYLRGEPLTKQELEDELRERRVPMNRWKATAGYLAGAMEFLFDQEPDVFWSEATVYSREHGYAGTPDIIGRMRIQKSQRPSIIDFKTSKAIYDEVALQLCAYSRTDFVGLDDGSEVPLYPSRGHGKPRPIRDGVAVRLTPTGGYEAVHFHLTDDLFDVFLHAKGVAQGAEIIRMSRGRGI